jgi:hypothetical protein
LTTANETQPQQAGFKQGDFAHIEFPVQDIARAKKFYGDLFGWTFQDVPEMDYTLFFTPSKNLGGGLFKPSERMPNKVINYLAVASIEETVAKLESYGGKAVSPKIEVPGHGYLTHCLDSEGTLFALWQGIDHPTNL